MKVFVIRDGEFTLCNGRPSSNLLHYEAFGERYLSVFSSVILVGRLFNEEDPSSRPVEGKNVQFSAMPGYHGPKGFLKNLPTILRSLFKTIEPGSAYILRVPATIPSLYSLILMLRRIPFAVEVVADPEDGYNRVALGGTKFGALICWGFVKLLKWQCRCSIAAAYVTEQALQRKYPGNAPENMFSFTSIDLKAECYAQQPHEYTGSLPLKLVMTGNMQKNLKGHDILLEALKSIRNHGLDAKATIIGFGENRSTLEQMASDLGISQYVEFVGKVSAGRAVADILDQADLFVLPSRQEGLPRALLEAMARGLPAIATRVGGTPELLNDQGLIEPNNPKELADRVIQFVTNTTLMNEQAKRNLDLSKKYSIEIVSSARKAFYARVTERCLKP